jgi:hypothetical protein
MAKRLSVILSDGDEEALKPFFEVGSRHHEALQRWAEMNGSGAANSEAALIRALMQAGAQALGDEILNSGYAEYAEFYNTPEERSERRNARDRYAKRTETPL